LADVIEHRLVGVFNSSVELAELLEYALEEEGYRTVSLFTHEIKRGDVNLNEFFEEHDPRVVVYDIAIPYEENWRLFNDILEMPAAAGRRWVLTTTNKAVLDELVGITPALEIIGKPFDLDQMLAAVRRALAELEGREPA
jgi:DNA-binding NtrC family response regulator